MAGGKIEPVKTPRKALRSMSATPSATRWWITLGTLAAGEKPFYLQFHTYAVHTPVQARPDLRKAAAQQARDRLDADYLGFIAGVDENIGRLLKALEDPNGDGDTTDSIRKDTGEPAGPPPMP